MAGLDFLIVGAGRSGTSLLTALLDQHSQLSVGFEVGGVDCLLGRAVPELPGRVLDTRVSAFFEACRHAAATSGAPRWGNKITTEQLAGLNRQNLHQHLRGLPPVPVLEIFFNQYLAGVPVIFLLRDGRACVDSKMRRAGQDLEKACGNWLYGVEVHDFLQSRPNTLFLRFEELLTHPRECLDGVLAFLGLEFEDSLLSEQGTRHPAMLPAYRRSGIDVSRAARPSADHVAVPLIGEALQRCGYL